MYKRQPNTLTAAEQIISPLFYNKRISNFTNSNPIDITEPFTLSANFNDIVEITSEVDNFRYSYDFTSILIAFTTLHNLAPVDARKLDFKVMQPITVVINSYYPKLWPGAKVIFSQPAQNIANKYYELTHKVNEQKDGIYLTSTFILPKQVIKVDDYANFYQQVKDFPQHSQSLFVYKNSKQIDDDSVVIGSDITSKIKQAQNLLEKSQFSKAIIIIKEIIMAEENNAQAQYLLGLALGFTGDDIQSEQAFARAEQLGYQL